MAATGALIILLAIVLLRSGLAAAREGVGAVGYVAELFTSGFTKGTAPKAAGWVITIPQIALAALFAAMLISSFLPGARVFLHVIAALAGVALVWYVRMMLTEVKLEILCLPALVIWFCYYAFCVFWNGNHPLGVAGAH